MPGSTDDVALGGAGDCRRPGEAHHRHIAEDEDLLDVWLGISPAASLVRERALQPGADVVEALLGEALEVIDEAWLEQVANLVGVARIEIIRPLRERASDRRLIGIVGGGRRGAGRNREKQGQDQPN